MHVLRTAVRRVSRDHFDMITEDPKVRQQLSATKERLVREFGATTAGRVAECFDRAVRGIVVHARIGEFLPLLAERHTRDCVDEASA